MLGRLSHPPFKEPAIFWPFFSLSFWSTMLMGIFLRKHTFQATLFSSLHTHSARIFIQSFQCSMLLFFMLLFLRPEKNQMKNNNIIWHFVCLFGFYLDFYSFLFFFSNHFNVWVSMFKKNMAKNTTICNGDPLNLERTFSFIIKFIIKTHPNIVRLLCAMQRRLSSQLSVSWSIQFKAPFLW